VTGCERNRLRLLKNFHSSGQVRVPSTRSCPNSDQDASQWLGVFLDSSPDRWGRTLMVRREAQRARQEGRAENPLFESDYLLGVHDGHRMGGLRFRTNPAGRFLDDTDALAAPPWTSLQELENASLQLERDDAEDDSEYSRWLNMLIAPGGSLGGARPKASVLDKSGNLWIAKFPSRSDTENVGAWEAVVQELAKRAGIRSPVTQLHRFGSRHDTLLSRRFDRDERGGRFHFSSALTLLERSDGDDASTGASYLELAEVLVQYGSRTNQDLEELWRRIAFNVCVSNTDDHLRNHGFLLERTGWFLAPAYDMNPDPQGDGLRLNISDSDNSQELDLVVEVADYFRLSTERAQCVLREVVEAARTWREVAEQHGISSGARQRMRRAFRCCDRPAR